MFNSPESVLKPLKDAQKEALFALDEIRNKTDPIDISENQVVRFMEAYVDREGINGVSLNLAKFNDERGIWFSCENQKDTGFSNRSLSEAKDILNLKRGAN
jgi:hypothetical protein